MNPEVKKIGNKLFDKVELTSQKVELGIIQDIEERALNNSKSAQNIDNDFTNFMQLKTKIQANLKSLLQENNSLTNKIKESEKVLKDLGIDDKSLFKAKTYASQVDELAKSIEGKLK